MILIILFSIAWIITFGLIIIYTRWLDKPVYILDGDWRGVYSIGMKINVGVAILKVTKVVYLTEVKKTRVETIKLFDYKDGYVS